MKILYAEDQQSVIELVKLLLSEIGISDVVYAKNGQEALELYKNDTFDLVVTDMLMPVMNGFELIEEIKKIDSKQIFMMVTGMDDKEDLIKAIELRVNFFLEKPIKPEKLEKVMKEAKDLIDSRKEARLSNLLLTQYKHLIDSAAIISKADKKGIITYINEQFCKISKYDTDELIGKPHNITRDPDMPRSIFKDLWETIGSKKTWKGIITNRAKDGSIYIVDTFIMPLLDENDEIIEYISIRHDITELEFYKYDF